MNKKMPVSKSESLLMEFSSVDKSFFQEDGKIEILSKIDLQIAKGQKIAIVGQSGVGKSTFLSLAAGLDIPDYGEIYYQSINLKNIDLDRYRRENIAIIFQHFFLVPYLTALENVSLPFELKKQPEAKSKAKELLQMLGLGERLQNRPSQLSGGEQQRVAIARAIASESQLLLADEPTGNLDSHTGDLVMNYLFQLCRDLNVALLLVTHNHELARQCDLIYELKSAKLHKVT
ncbi:MAG: ABC transporter ATP-binding protein [Oligoflexales bacterium]|nr:ABC transporter ATP-binding protein [Oligoflexales bacterium]